MSGSGTRAQPRLPSSSPAISTCGRAYARALKGEIKNFTGVDSPYEPPEAPEIHLRTLGRSPEDMIDILDRWLAARHLVEENGSGSGR